MADTPLDEMPRFATDEWPTKTDAERVAVMDEILALDRTVLLTTGGKVSGVLVPYEQYLRMAAVLPPQERPGYDEVDAAADQRWRETFRALRGSLKDVPEITP